MAGTTGLEPATSAVTGQRSNQLSYVPPFKTGAHSVRTFRRFQYKKEKTFRDLLNEWGQTGQIRKAATTMARAIR